jgi:hypothetical protein
LYGRVMCKCIFEFLKCIFRTCHVTIEPMYTISSDKGARNISDCMPLREFDYILISWFSIGDRFLLSFAVILIHFKFNKFQGIIHFFQMQVQFRRACQTIDCNACELRLREWPSMSNWNLNYLMHAQFGIEFLKYDLILLVAAYSSSICPN